MQSARFRIRLTPTLLGALILASCGGESPTSGSTDPGPVASVVVTPNTNTLTSIDATQQFQASARDAAGATISGKSFTWTSSTPSVATVNSTGLAAAVTNGSSMITATTDGVSGTASLTVAYPVLAVSYDSTSTTPQTFWFSAEVINWTQGIEFDWVLALCETATPSCNDPFAGGTATVSKLLFGRSFDTLNDQVGLLFICTLIQAQGGEVFLVLAAAFPNEEPKQAEVKLC